MIIEHQASRIGFEPDLYSPFCADLDSAGDAERLRRAGLGMRRRRNKEKTLVATTLDCQAMLITLALSKP